MQCYRNVYDNLNETFLGELRIQLNQQAIKAIQKHCAVDDDRATVCIMKAVTGLNSICVGSMPLTEVTLSQHSASLISVSTLRMC